MTARARDVGPLESLLASATPTVAVSVADDHDDADLAAALAAGADVVELRLDRCGDRSTDAAVRLARRVSAPTLATVRSAAEGGAWDGADEERLELFTAVAPHVGGLDVELSSKGILADVIALAHRYGGVAVVSHHDFDGTPDSDTLGSVVTSARDAGADVVKVSTTARALDDVARLARLTLEHAPDGVVVIAMGEIGAMSRVFFPALGSAMTFGSWGGQRAPGQLELAELVEQVRRFYPGSTG